MIDNLEVIESGVTAEVEKILSETAVASAVSLTIVNRSEAMFDGDTLSQVGSAVGCSCALSQLDEKSLLWMECDAATALGGSPGAELSLRADDALVGWEMGN